MAEVKETEKKAKAGTSEKKGGNKTVAASAGKSDGDIHCHYCGTRESTYWRRGPDGPKTLCNSCGLNWFRQRPMQREQVEKNNLMAKAVAAAQLKRPANALKEGPEKRKREEKKDGSKLREQLQGKRSAEAAQQRPRKKQKRDEVPLGLKGLKRSDKASIGRKLGDAAVKKAALIKRTPSQLSLMGLLESAPQQASGEAQPPDAVASKPLGALKGARFSPLKQAQTLGAQKLLAVLNVIKQKKGFGRVTSTASLESVPEEGASDHMEGAARREEVGVQDLAETLTPRKTGTRSQRRPNTALLQGASFLPWKNRPRGWETSSLTFAAAESRLLKAQALGTSNRARPPVLKRAKHKEAPQAKNGIDEGTLQEEDGFAGYGVLRKLLEEAEVPGTSPRSKGRPPLNKKGGASLPKPQASHARPQLSSYESFEDLVKGTAGGMQRYESFEDLALRAGPVFSRIESFEELALKAQPSMRRFESFEDLAMRSEPVFEVPTLATPRLPDGRIRNASDGLDEGTGGKNRPRKKQKAWDWEGPIGRGKDDSGEATGHIPRLNEQPGEATGHLSGQQPEERNLLPGVLDEQVIAQNARAPFQPPSHCPNGQLVLPSRLEAPPKNGQAQAQGGSELPGASVQNSLGSRGLSSRALHLLVDCAVDTEPPPKGNMLMQDLQTLAINRAALLRSRGLLAGADGVTFAFPNGQLLQQARAGRALPAGKAGLEEMGQAAGPSAGPESKGDLMAGVAGPVSPSGTHGLPSEGPAQKSQTKQNERELRCAEQLHPHEAQSCPGAPRGALPPSEVLQKPGH